MNSEELKKISQKLYNIDKMLGALNSGCPVEILLNPPGEQFSLYLSVNPDDQASYDLSSDINKALCKHRAHVERRVQSIVRP